MLVLTIIILGGAYIAVSLFLFFSQHRLLYYPDYPGRALTLTPENISLYYEPVSFETRDSVTLFGWFVPKAHSRGTMVVFHGNAGNISHRLELIQLFHRLGLNTFIFDYRGYGQSEGRPSEHGQYLDAEAAWLHLLHSRNIPSEEMVFFGRSLGGPIAAWLAQKHSPGALIIESSFTSIPELAAEFYPYFPVKLLCRYRYNTAEYIARTNCPILVIHNAKDELVPFRHGQKLFEVAHEPKEFMKTIGTHNELDWASREKYEESIKSFILRFLPNLD